MRNLLFLFFIFVCSTVFSQGKDEFNYKATYKLTYQIDSTNIESKKSEEMVLYLGKNISKFSSLGKHLKDSLLIAYKDKPHTQANFFKMKSQIPKTEFHYTIYKGIPNGKISYTEEILQDKYKYTLDSPFHWKISPETDVIAGFPVQKATTNFAGRHYSAWFTSEIPIPDGPYKFKGLPGLIVKITDDKKHYDFILTAFQKLKKPINFTFEEGEYLNLSREQFLEVKEEYKQDPIGYFRRQNTGITLEFKEGQLEKLNRAGREKRKRENNPIELE